MNSHIQSASSLEASLPSSSAETVVQMLASTPASAITCDPANGIHAPGCACADKRVRLNRCHSTATDRRSARASGTDAQGSPVRSGWRDAEIISASALLRAFDRSPSGEEFMRHTSIPSLDEQADHAALVRSLNQLVREELTRNLSVEAMTVMLDSGIAGLASLANAASVAEGRLLEKVIALIAESNLNLAIFAQVRLPVREDALELVDKNPEALYRGLTLDANARTRKVYVADLIIVDRRTRVAHVVDIKRSLGSYETARIVELRQRMLAAALVAPDLLWKDHQRIAVDEVRVVILEAAGRRTDLKSGIWSFAYLDHLLGVTGAADLVRQVRQDFDRLTEQNLSEAREQLRRKHMVTPPVSCEPTNHPRARSPGSEFTADRREAFESPVRARLDGDAAEPRSSGHALRIGVAPPPPTAH
jgi:hypothetical protein